MQSASCSVKFDCIILVMFSADAQVGYCRSSSCSWIQVGGRPAFGMCLENRALVTQCKRRSCAGVKGDWEAISANPVKLGLGVLSMLYDCTLMAQHYLLYYDCSNARYGRLPDKPPTPCDNAAEANRGAAKRAADERIFSDETHV